MAVRVKIIAKASSCAVVATAVYWSIFHFAASGVAVSDASLTYSTTAFVAPLALVSVFLMSLFGCGLLISIRESFAPPISNTKSPIRFSLLQAILLYVILGAELGFLLSHQSPAVRLISFIVAMMLVFGVWVGFRLYKAGTSHDPNLQ